MKSFHLPGIHPCSGDSVISIYYRFSILKINTITQAIRSDQISRSVVSSSLRPHESQHARPPCPSPTPGVHSDSSPSSQWCHPAISSSVVPLSSCPQSLPASVFSNESTLRMRWPKYWSFSFGIIPSKEIPGLISFRMDWLDLLAVQGTLKSLLHHHSSKASILQCSAFFTVQLSHPYMTTGKTIALTSRTFVGKVMSLLLNMLSWNIISFFLQTLEEVRITCSVHSVLRPVSVFWQWVHLFFPSFLTFRIHLEDILRVSIRQSFSGWRQWRRSATSLMKACEKCPIK